ncbi:MAG TPA: DUF6259 domain-containing protein [Phycisphaerae bacterium]|nr:DUF6259 domain-containing protein [Phycisphaerae bacterium]HRR87031.1 DUF6259 domain-containing protein [Phycisphaerae bacterium]
MRFEFFRAASVCLVLAAVHVSPLPAGEASRERQRVEIGWHDDFRTDSGWLRENSDAPDHGDHAAIAFGSDGAVVSVASSNRATAWTRTTNPIWVNVFPFLEVRYSIRESGSGAQVWLLLSDDSTGPVTPGALNPENPLAGDHEALVGPLSRDQDRAVFDLRALFPSDRVARISLRITTEAAPTTVELRRLAFWASDPRLPSPQATRPTCTAILPPEDDFSTSRPSQRGVWQPVQLPQRDVISAAWLTSALETPVDWPAGKDIERGGILFRLGDADRAAMCSGVMERESLDVSGSSQGCELALLLATRMFGSGVAWYGQASVKPRTTITSPHQLAVRLEYEDGSTSIHLPWSVRRKTWAVDRSPDVYIVPMDADKSLVRFSVVDGMSYGQVFLLAASLNSTSSPSFPQLRPKAEPRRTRQAPVPVTSPTQWHRAGNRFTVNNAWLRLAAEVETGLRLEQLGLVPFDREILNAKSPAPFVEVLGEDGRVLSMRFEAGNAGDTAGGARLDFRWSLAPSEHKLSLSVSVEDAGRIRMVPTLHNQTAQTWKTALRIAQLRECRISPIPGDSGYLVGTRNALQSRVPTSIRKDYSGVWPLPLVDLFAEQAGGGLGLFVIDSNLLPKAIEFKQTDSGADIAIEIRELTVPPDGHLVLPPVTLMAHTGDWHDLFNAYRAEAVAETPPDDKRLEESFYCRRDYPLGGTGHLFTPLSLRYTPERLIAESNEAFGGIHMIDISGWAYSRATGRVGDYLSNDLGGLSELRRMVERSHAEGIKVGLYFEGYLIDRRSDLARKALPDWQSVDKTGKPRWWSGDMEFFACPGVEAWRRELAGRIAKVAHETGADAVYVDQFGLLGPGKACWAPNHGHPIPSNPILEERAMLRTIREALDKQAPGTAIYIEYTPVDGLMDLVDAAFDYGLWDVDAGWHPASLPLYRYVFPKLASFEMVGHGIRPIPVEVDDLHRCIFHGLGIWLKGRADSWYTPQFRELARQAYPIFREHADIFRSRQCEPLVPTLQEDLYANRFAGRDRTIITLYNAGCSSVAGELMQVPLPPEWSVVSLLPRGEADAQRDKEQVTIRGTVAPRSVAVFLLSAP